MKKTMTLFLVLLAGASLAAQVCSTFAGTSFNDTTNVCEADSFFVPFLGGEFLDTNDALIFVVHDGSPTVLGNILAFSSTPEFSQTSYPFINEVVYRIAAVAGNAGGVYGVDLSDQCLSVSSLGVLVSHANPNVSCIGDTLTCADSVATLECFGNDPPYTFLWSNGNTGNPTPAWSPGMYLVWVQNSFGCWATDTVVVVQDISFPVVSIAQPPPLPCDGSPITLQAIANGGTGNLTYQWNGPANFTSNLLNPLVYEEGTYCVTVSDQNGCSSQACVIVTGQFHFTLSIPPIVCFGLPELFQVNVTGASPGLNVYVQENDGPPQLLPSNMWGWGQSFTETTTFKFWATDGAGCASDTISKTVQIALEEIDFTVETNGCEQVTITAIASGSAPPFNYQWSTGTSGNQFSTTSSGWYYVTVTSNTVCSAKDSVFIALDYPANCSYIEGTLKQDSLDNCQPNPNEPPLAHWFVVAEGLDTFYALTDSAGFYSMPVDPGSYVVRVVPPNPLWFDCQPGQAVSVSAPGEVGVADFRLWKLFGCPMLSVDISTLQLRRCNSNNFYYISYCNEGSEDATDAYVEVVFDDFLTLTNAQLPFQNLGNNTFRFDLGDVLVGDCGSFWAQVYVGCDAVLGQTHCTEAHIFPDTICTPWVPAWSGATLEVTSECTDSVRFIIKNTGTSGMAAPLEYVVIEDAVMYLTGSGDPLPPGGEMTLAFPANGSTWRVEVQQEDLHPFLPEEEFLAVEGCGVNGSGSFSMGFVNQFPQSDPQPWLDVDCTENMASYDPNDKQGFPTGYANEHFIEPGTELEYLVRFQNTGTDTAFQVVIRDTLSPNLDLASVRTGASSHAYEFEIYGTGILKFTFPNILLPDSAANEPTSHGFVSYRVSQRDGVLPGAKIENRAGIYFDFNEPVLTNTTWHTVGENFVVSDIRSVFAGVEISVAPNPVSGSARVELKGLETGKALTFSVLDVAGGVVRAEEFAAPGFEFERRGLAAGMYFFRIEQAGRLVGFGKMVLR